MHKCVINAILLMLEYAPSLPDPKIVKKRVPYLNSFTANCVQGAAKENVEARILL